jgi:hypothetical protein
LKGIIVRKRKLEVKLLDGMVLKAENHKEEEVVILIFKYQVFLKGTEENYKYSEFCVLKSGDMLFRCTNKKCTM